MTCSVGDLVLIPFPFSDLSTAKRRPVLVLRAPDRYGDFIALAVTSVRQEEAARLLTTDSLVQGSLPKQSWVRLDKVFTLSSESIVKSIARVREEALKEILAGMCEQLGHVSR